MGASKFSKIFQQDFYDFGEFPPHFELIFRRGEAGGAKVMPHQQKVAGVPPSPPRPSCSAKHSYVCDIGVKIGALLPPISPKSLPAGKGRKIKPIGIELPLAP